MEQRLQGVSDMKSSPICTACLAVVNLAMAGTLVGCKSDNAIDTLGDGSLSTGPDGLSKEDAPADKPWDLGPDTSPNKDAQAEMPWNPSPDTSPNNDVPADLTWTWDPDFGSGAGTSKEAGLDAPGLDASLDATPPDVAGTCPAGYVLGYTSAGCGSEAKPVCSWANQDACAKYACSCSGMLIGGCDFFSEPWSNLTNATRGCGDQPDPFDARTVDVGEREAETHP
jgi:hypothetical protein